MSISLLIFHAQANILIIPSIRTSFNTDYIYTQIYINNHHNSSYLLNPDF